MTGWAFEIRGVTLIVPGRSLVPGLTRKELGARLDKWVFCK
jgi:hypothetical protein